LLNDALLLLAMSLAATAALLLQVTGPSDESSFADAGATASLGDDPVTVAVLCGGISL
jgi:hypothetical protein